MEEERIDAKEAGLVYISDRKKGFSRKRAGEEFVFLDREGRVIRNQVTLDRIKSIVIPPAWQNVWISPLRNSHLQATGFDAKGRKQYRYHPKWAAARNEKKFSAMREFGELLPLIREKIGSDLRKKSLGREKVLATVVALLDKTLIRIGNKEYARDNKSFGLTTLQNTHVKNLGVNIRLEFTGKSKVEQELIITDKRLAQIIRKCKELPGYELFQYIDEKGERHKVSSDHINEYLKELSGKNITSKYFRTWGGSCIAIKALLKFPNETEEKTLKKKINTAIKEVSASLGNTPSVCRNYYIHPVIFDRYREQQLLEIAKEKERHIHKIKHLQKEELIFLSILQDMTVTDS